MNEYLAGYDAMFDRQLLQGVGKGGIMNAGGPAGFEHTEDQHSLGTDAWSAPASVCARTPSEDFS